MATITGLSFLLSLHCLHLSDLPWFWSPILTLSSISGGLGGLFFAPLIFNYISTYVWFFTALFCIVSWEARRVWWTSALSIMGYILWFALGLIATYGYST
jgi:hypothetical protein